MIKVSGSDMGLLVGPLACLSFPPGATELVPFTSLFCKLYFRGLSHCEHLVRYKNMYLKHNTLHNSGSLCLPLSFPIDLSKFWSSKYFSEIGSL